MSQEWDGSLLDELLSQNAALQDEMSVWELMEHLSAGRILHVESKEAFALALDEVFMEMYHNIVKKVILFFGMFNACMYISVCLSLHLHFLHCVTHDMTQ